MKVNKKVLVGAVVALCVAAVPLGTAFAYGGNNNSGNNGNNGNNATGATRVAPAKLKDITTIMVAVTTTVAVITTMVAITTTVAIITTMVVITTMVAITTTIMVIKIKNAIKREMTPLTRKKPKLLSQRKLLFQPKQQILQSININL